MSILQMEERLHVLATLVGLCIHQNDAEAGDYYYAEYLKVDKEIEDTNKLWQSQ